MGAIQCRRVAVPLALLLGSMCVNHCGLGMLYVRPQPRRP